MNKIFLPTLFFILWYIKEQESKNLIEIDIEEYLLSCYFSSIFQSKKNTNQHISETFFIISSFIKRGIIKNAKLYDDGNLVNVVFNSEIGELNNIKESGLYSFKLININYELLKNFYNEYLYNWENGLLIKHGENILTPKNQLSGLLDTIFQEYNLYGKDVLIGNYYILKQIDLLASLVFLENKKLIKILGIEFDFNTTEIYSLTKLFFRIKIENDFFQYFENKWGVTNFKIDIFNLKENEKLNNENNYNPSDYLSDSLDIIFIYFIYSLVFQNKKRVLTKYQEDSLKELKDFSKKLKKDNEELGVSLGKTINEKYGEGFKNSIFGFNYKEILLDFSKALSYKLVEKLYVEVQDVSEAFPRSDNLPKLIEEIEITNQKFILTEIPKEYLKGKQYLLSFIFKPIEENILKYFNLYFDKWENKELKSLSNNYILPSKQIEDFNIYLRNIQKDYGSIDIKVNLIDETKKYGKKIDFLSCILFFQKKGIINITEIRKLENIIIFDIVNLKEEKDNIINELIFDGINLLYGIESKELNGYQLKFAEFIFEIDKGITKHKWNDCEEHIYGKNGNPPNNGLSEIIKKINQHLKKIGCSQKFSYSDSNYILLKK